MEIDQDTANRWLIKAAKEPDSELLEQALRAGADINVQDGEGNTALHLSIINPWQPAQGLKIAQELIDHGGRSYYSKQGRRNASSSCRYSWLYGAGTKPLRGADPNVRDNNGNTPLHEAVQRRSTMIAQLLITYGAHSTIANKYGHSPEL